VNEGRKEQTKAEKVKKGNGKKGREEKRRHIPSSADEAKLRFFAPLRMTFNSRSAGYYSLLFARFVIPESLLLDSEAAITLILLHERK
jgi:hypothetical protein